jgi:hypothetical protein
MPITRSCPSTHGAVCGRSEARACTSMASEASSISISPRHRGQRARSRPSAPDQGDAGSGRHADARVEPVRLARRARRWRSGWSTSASPTRCSSPIRASRRSSARSRPRAAIITSRQPAAHKLITFKNAFHGRSIGAISATDQPKMRDGFEPLLPGFAYAPFNDLEGALALIDDETAGFLVEPCRARAA